MQPDVMVTLDTLHLVFSAFGVVQKIATFEKGQGFQALVQYTDAETAEQVRPPSSPFRFEGECMYHYISCHSTALQLSIFLCQPVSLPAMHVYSTPNLHLELHWILTHSPAACSGPTHASSNLDGHVSLL